MRKINKNNKELLVYLDAMGVLERGSDEEIAAAKKVYRKDYLLKFKRNQRAKRPEFIVPLSRHNGEYSMILCAAKKHRMSISAFLRTATLSYLNKTYIVPDRYQVAELELLLSACLNEIQTIVSKRDSFYWEREEKYKQIEERISRLESEINSILTKPVTLEELVIREIEQKPVLKVQLLEALNHYGNDH